MRAVLGVALLVGSSYEDSRGQHTRVKREREWDSVGGGVRNLNSVSLKAAVLREHCHRAMAAKTVF